MATKQLIENSIWNDVWFKSLSDRSKVLFFYLLINPEQTPAGIFEIDLDVISIKLKIKDPLAEIRKLADKVVFDEKKSLIWIKNYYQKNSNGPKIQKSVENTVKKHRTSFIAVAFCDYNNLDFDIDRVSIEYQRGIDTIQIVSNEHEHDNDNDNENDNEKKPKIYSLVFDYWNSKENLPKVKAKSEGRIKKIKTLTSKSGFLGSFECWSELIDTVALSDFLTGKNDRGWTADFDWCITPANAVKIYEGKYTRGKRAGAMVNNGKPKDLPDVDTAAEQYLSRVRS